MAGKLGAAIYRSREWQGLRAAYRAAAGGLCADCGGFGFEAHHVVPLYLGGPPIPPPGRRGVAVPDVSFSETPIEAACRVGVST